MELLIWYLTESYSETTIVTNYHCQLVASSSLLTKKSSKRFKLLVNMRKLCMNRWMWFSKIRNNFGPMCDPCGTPEETNPSLEIKLVWRSSECDFSKNSLIYFWDSSPKFRAPSVIAMGEISFGGWPWIWPWPRRSTSKLQMETPTFDPGNEKPKIIRLDMTLSDPHFWPWVI